MHYGEIAERKEYKPDVVLHCKLWECPYYAELYDESDAEYGEFSCPWCNKANTALPESWMGEFDCVAEFEEEEEDSICANAPLSAISSKPHEGS